MPYEDNSSWGHMEVMCAIKIDLYDMWRTIFKCIVLF